jgi:hypothetical protein
MAGDECDRCRQKVNPSVLMPADGMVYTVSGVKKAVRGEVVCRNCMHMMKLHRKMLKATRGASPKPSASSEPLSPAVAAIGVVPRSDEGDVQMIEPLSDLHDILDKQSL